MSTVITPRTRGCATTDVAPTLAPDAARDLAAVAKALADPTRLLVLDLVRAAAPEAICPCDIQPHVDISQPALSRHVRVLVDAGVLASERRGTWTYLSEVPGAVDALASWLADGGDR